MSRFALVGRSLLTATLMTLAVSAGADEGYEHGGIYSAASLLPTQAISGPHYKIRDRVVSDGFMLNYMVDSDYGVFQATGDFALQKILNEIGVITRLKEISNTKAFADSVVYAAKSPLRFGESLITDPVDTITGVPRGLFAIFENAGESMTTTSSPSEDGAAKQLLQVSSWKRDYCGQYGCDVYSSNKVLQEELNRIGWASAIGGLTVSAATTAASGGAVMVFSAMRTSDQLTSALRSEPPARLRIINEGKLRAAGIPDAVVQKFLDHPAYTPRHQTLIADAISRLGGVKGLDGFLQLCLRAQDEIGANYFQNVADILAGYHLKTARLQEIVPLLGIAAASASNGHTLVPLAWDYGVFEAAAVKRMDYGVQEFTRRGLSTKFDIWTTGRVSPLMKQEAGKRGFTIMENVEKIIPISQ